MNCIVIGCQLPIAGFMRLVITDSCTPGVAHGA